MSTQRFFAIAAALCLVPLSGCLAGSEMEDDAMDPEPCEVEEAEDALCTLPFDPSYIGFFDSNHPIVSSLSSAYPYLPNDGCGLKKMHRVRGYGIHSNLDTMVSYSAAAPGNQTPTNQAACLDSFAEVDAYHYKNSAWTWKGTKKTYGAWSNNTCYVSASVAEPLSTSGYQAFQANGRYWNAQLGQFAPVWSSVHQYFIIP